MRGTLLHVATARFDAARSVACLADGHRCRRLHGHGFVLRVAAELPAAWAPEPGGELAALAGCAARAAADLDYRFLNEWLAHPTDEELARWLWRRLERQGVAERSVHGLRSVAVESTPDEGVELLAGGRVRVRRRATFSAAHRLPRVPEGHPCGRLHGHDFVITLEVEAELPPAAPIAIDYQRLAEAWEPLGRQLEGRLLNELPGLDNPTSEVLARWLWDRLRPELPELTAVIVAETCTAGCRWDGARHRIWKEFRAESCLRLPGAGPGGRPRWQGHGFALRLHLAPPFDQALGWTIDFREVKRRSAPVVERLDHACLDDLPELPAPGLAGVARWAAAAMHPLLPDLVGLDLEDRAGNGVQLTCDGC